MIFDWSFRRQTPITPHSSSELWVPVVVPIDETTHKLAGLAQFAVLKVNDDQPPFAFPAFVQDEEVASTQKVLPARFFAPGPFELMPPPW